MATGTLNLITPIVLTYGNNTFVAVASTDTGNRVMTSPDAVAVLPAVSIAANPSGSITAGTSVTFTATPPTAAPRQVINGKKAAPTLAPTAPPTWALRELILPTAISSPAS